MLLKRIALSGVVLAGLMLALVSCTLPSRSSGGDVINYDATQAMLQQTVDAMSSQMRSTDNIQATKAAISLAATVNASNLETQAARIATKAAEVGTQAVQTAQAAEQLVAQQTQSALQAAQIAARTQANATNAARQGTPTPGSQASATSAPQPTATPARAAQDTQALLQNAKILLYEDATASGLERYVKQALDEMKLPYTDIKDALGRFKSHLTSETEWDLVIVAAESRGGIQGEFFVYLNQQLDRGASVVVELWTLDDIINGKIAPMLERCGIELRQDWILDSKDNRSLVWLGDHPMLHSPNEDVALERYQAYWVGDSGDLTGVAPGSDTVLVSSPESVNSSDMGNLAVCNNGQFILQTYSTHDYEREDVVKVWQNMIEYALLRRLGAP